MASLPGQNAFHDKVVLDNKNSASFDIIIAVLFNTYCYTAKLPLSSFFIDIYWFSSEKFRDACTQKVKFLSGFHYWKRDIISRRHLKCIVRYYWLRHAGKELHGFSPLSEGGQCAGHTFSLIILIAFFCLFWYNYFTQYTKAMPARYVKLLAKRWFIWESHIYFWHTQKCINTATLTFLSTLYIIVWYT